MPDAQPEPPARWPPAPSAAHRPWWILAGTCAGLFLMMLDSTALTLALPDIQRDLHATSAELQWVVNVYLLSVCVLVITFSRLGDQFGRRTVFLAGLATFTLGAVVGALATSPEVLIGGRVLQGIGGAAMLGLSLAIVSNAFDDATRPRALGVWTSVSSLALALGPVIGGLLVAQVSWRAILWMVPPIALAGMGITWWAAPNRRDPTSGRRVDVPGLLALTLGLTAIVVALIEGPDWGWGSPVTIGLLVLGVVALAALWVVEHRVASPIIEFDLFGSRSYLGACAAAFALVGAYWGVIYYQPQFLQDVLGYGAATAGLLILPITAPMILFSSSAGMLAQRFGARPTMTLGMALGTAGVLWQTQVSADTSYWTGLFPGFVLFGVALALVYTPMSTAAMEALPRAKAGIAAGVLAMERVFAGAFLLALTGAVFLHVQDHDVDAVLQQGGGSSLTAAERSDLDGLLAGSAAGRAAVADLPASIAGTLRADAADAFAAGLSAAMWVLVAVMVIGTALTWLLLTRDAVRPADAAPAPEDLHHHVVRHHL